MSGGYKECGRRVKVLSEQNLKTQNIHKAHMNLRELEGDTCEQLYTPIPPYIITLPNSHTGCFIQGSAIGHS